MMLQRPLRVLQYFSQLLDLTWFDQCNLCAPGQNYLQLPAGRAVQKEELQPILSVYPLGCYRKGFGSHAYNE